MSSPSDSVSISKTSVGQGIKHNRGDPRGGRGGGGEGGSGGGEQGGNGGADVGGGGGEASTEDLTSQKTAGALQGGRGLAPGWWGADVMMLCHNASRSAVYVLLTVA